MVLKIQQLKIQILVFVFARLSVCLAAKCTFSHLDTRVVTKVISIRQLNCLVLLIGLQSSLVILNKQFHSIPNTQIYLLSIFQSHSLLQMSHLIAFPSSVVSFVSMFPSLRACKKCWKQSGKTVTFQSPVVENIKYQAPPNFLVSSLGSVLAQNQNREKVK